MKASVQRILAILFLAVAFHSTKAQTGTNSVLVLYDGSGSFGWYGNLHAKMLGNLMGHFNLTPVIQPVENYTNGQIAQYRAVFYCGDTFDNPLPAAFTNDVSTTTNQVCWIKNNLWQISGNVFFPKPIDARIGFRVVTLDGLNPDFTINTNLDTTVMYKGESFTKNKADPTLGLIELVDTNIAVVPAVAWRTNNTTTNTYSVPYIVHGGNFWYVSDSPFDYMSEEDRYLVFADLLHDILLINHPESHTAIIRIEDIAPEVYQPGELTACTDYLKSNNVPFAMAVIPNYVDPLGYYNNNIPLEHNLADSGNAIARAMLGELRHATTNGGQVIMHGFTHQYDAVANPSTGVSADDFEFWREEFYSNSIDLSHYEPVPEDSFSWVSNRIQSGLAILNAVGLPPVAWEPPHYAASDLDYQYFATNFNLTMQRKLYFADDYTPANRHIAGQFFPYFIERDLYGERIMGENLGNYEPEPLAPSVARTAEEIVRAAKKNLVIRDGWANAFFHGFYDPTNLHLMVEGIKALGYTYVQLSPTGAPIITGQPTGLTNKLAGTGCYIAVGVSGAAPLSYQWIQNGTPVVDATNAVLNFNPSTTNQAGDYLCVITNAVGAVTSAVVNVDIGTAPGIAVQPLSQTNVLGLPFSFSVTVGGTAPFSYQWRMNGTDVAGQTNATLSLPASTMDMTNALFSVVITNRYGATTSAPALLFLHLPPVITGQPIPQAVLISNNLYFGVFFMGDAPIHLQWYFNTNTAIINATNDTVSIIGAKPVNNGTFSVVLTNAYGSVTSAPALLTVVSVPIITNQPASQSVYLGSNATFTAAVFGPPVLTMQWRLNGTNISGATTNSYTVTNVQPANLGDYTLVAQNSFGAVTSAVATLTANVPAFIVTNPASLQVGGGGNATFTVVAGGTQPLTYQWRFNGTNLDNAVTNSLTIANADLTNGGNYDVVVTNAFGSVTSAVAVLTVGFPPVITTNPVPLAVTVTSNATFTVGATGDNPLAYQWRFNGTNVAGATNTSLIIANAQLTDAGNYDAVVSSPYGSATSTVAALVVNAGPTVVTPPLSQTNFLGSNATFSVAVTGTAPLVYQWRFNGTAMSGANSNSVTLTGITTNDAGSYDVVVTNEFGAVTSAPAALVIVSGPVITNQPASLAVLVTSNATFTVGVTGTAPLAYQWRFNGTNVASATNTSLALANVQLTNAGNYDVVVGSPYGLVTSAVAVLTVNAGPAIVTPPASQTNSVGSNATFTVTVTGTAPLAYQWRFNGTNLATATTNSLTLTGLATNNAGSYDVVVTNAFGAVTSAPAVLAIVQSPVITGQPVSRTNLTGTTARFDVTNAGTAPLHYQWYRNGNIITNANSTAIVLSNVNSGAAASFFVVITNSYGSVTSATATLTVVLPPVITNQPVSLTNNAGTTANFAVSGIGGTAPFTYQWRFNGTNLAGALTNTLALANVQFTNQGSYDVVVSNAYAGVTSSVAVLTVNAGPQITVPPTNQLVVATSNATFAVTAIGSGTLAYQWRFNGTNLSGATASSLTISSAQPTDAGNYTVVVTNSFGSVTSAVAVLTVGLPPVITNAPTAQSVLVGQTATFTVFASGSEPLNYQWWLNNTNLVAGGSNSSLTLTNAQLADAGGYSVVVSNPYGTVTSAPTALTVNLPVVITNQPVSRTNSTGTTATFTVGASGTGPLAYQWRFNGTNVSTGTNATLSLPNVQAAAAGNYDVVVTNPYTNATSAVAVLTVVSATPPVLTLAPGSGHNTLGFNSDNGIGYTVEYRDSLLSGSWQVLTNVTGNGGTLNVDLTAPVDARFYRVRTP